MNHKPIGEEFEKLLKGDDVIFGNLRENQIQSLVFVVIQIVAHKRRTTKHIIRQQRHVTLPYPLPSPLSSVSLTQRLGIFVLDGQSRGGGRRGKVKEAAEIVAEREDQNGGKHGSEAGVRRGKVLVKSCEEGDQRDGENVREGVDEEDGEGKCVAEKRPPLRDI
jgi:hypothetical protein